MDRPLKIKIVRKKETLVGAEVSARPKADPLRPYSLRVKRDHGGGLWTLEDAEGQLFLAVRSRESNEVAQAAHREAQATGRTYREFSRSYWRQRRAADFAA